MAIALGADEGDAVVGLAVAQHLQVGDVECRHRRENCRRLLIEPQDDPVAARDGIAI